MQVIKNAVLAGILIAAVLAAGQDRSADERTIREQATAWTQAAAAKDLEKTVSYYADDAHMYPYNAPMTADKQQIRQVWAAFMAQPNFGIKTETKSVNVAKSGDLAYEVGTFEFSQSDAQGNPIATVGKYIVVWKKQANGQWKAVADIFNTDK